MWMEAPRAPTKATSRISLVSSPSKEMAATSLSLEAGRVAMIK